jgi:TM2 domain-containing membrane protein YozV
VNCANHPDTPAAAYCQFCGKPLCDGCMHRVGGVVACDPCLVARIGAATSGAPNAAPGAVPLGQPYAAKNDVWTNHPWGTEPWVAFCLGWIPGVGAMYNGQFIKGLVHVVVFALLINLTNVNGTLGILVAAWVFYQVFDAYQTARARRDGLPLPNPLGLNDIGAWFSARDAAPANPAATPPPANTASWAAGAPYTASSQAIPPVPPEQFDTPDLHLYGRHAIPTGAVALIVIGVGFLLANMGILSQHWIDRGWPILLIGLGVWLVIQRSQHPPQTGGRR